MIARNANTASSMNTILFFMERDLSDECAKDTTGGRPESYASVKKLGSGLRSAVFSAGCRGLPSVVVPHLYTLQKKPQTEDLTPRYTLLHAARDDEHSSRMVAVN